MNDMITMLFIFGYITQSIIICTQLTEPFVEWKKEFDKEHMAYFGRQVSGIKLILSTRKR